MMPIKDKSLYPANWEDISKRIRSERANNKCEVCGVENGIWIWRSYTNPANYLTLRDDGIYYDMDGDAVRLSELPDEYMPRTDREYDTGHDIKVVLTVAHLDHNPANNAESNLKALCQRCHLVHDAKHNAAIRKQTRLAKLEQAVQALGQGRLLP